MKTIISVYELLGLIKDGKAPKLVKYDNYIWEYKKQFDDYFNDEEYLIENGFDSWNNAKDFLEEKVEIIEEKTIIEKLNIENDIPTQFYIRNEYGTKCSLTKHSKIIADKLNEVIEFLNRKEDK